MKKIAMATRCNPRLRVSRKKRAFTLIEVVLSLGVFTFAFLSIGGLMATGLSTVKTSSSNQAISNIDRNLRANLQAMPYTNLVIGTFITYYYTDAGYPTTASSAAPSAPFFTTVLTPVASAYPAGSGTSANSYSISATISYPYPANRQVITNSYFVAQ